MNINSHDALVTTITSTFRSEIYLETFLNNCLQQSLFPNTIFSLNMSEPTKKELDIVQKFKPFFGPHLQVTRHKTRIPIYQAWNEICIRAKSPFLAIWNVDDLRTKTSLESQLLLIRSEVCHSVAGPFTIVNEFGSVTGQYIDQSNATFADWSKGMLHGPFFMFRREDLKILKGFDEQFEVAADFDFALRLSSLGHVGYTANNLGYYLNNRTGMSTKRGSRLPPERECIYLRHGIIEKVDLGLLYEATRFDPSRIYVGGKAFSLQICMGDQKKMLDMQYLIRTKRLWIKHLRRLRNKELQNSMSHYFKHPIKSIKFILTNRR